MHRTLSEDLQSGPECAALSRHQQEAVMKFRASLSEFTRPLSLVPVSDAPEKYLLRVKGVAISRLRPIHDGEDYWQQIATLYPIRLHKQPNPPQKEHLGGALGAADYETHDKHRSSASQARWFRSQSHLQCPTAIGRNSTLRYSLNTRYDL
jgi:hypothetical protein